MAVLSRLRFPFTIAAALVAALLIVGAMVGHVDFIRINAAVFEEIETHELDDILACLALIPLGIGIDHVRASKQERHQKEIEAQRLRVLKATMTTVLDIVNNFLNNLQLFRLDAEEVLPQSSIELFDQLVLETSVKLKVLGDLEATPEKAMTMGMGIDYEKEKPPRDAVATRSAVGTDHVR